MATSKHPRLIDRLPPIKRQKLMAVIVLSPARSGTTSVESALTYLGYDVYQGMKHAFLHARRGENTYPQWSEALDAKYQSSFPDGSNKRYGVIKPYESEEFEKILGNYDAIKGWPLRCFVDEVLEAYPDVKIVLMDRPVDSWAKSMRRTLVTRLTWPSWKILLPLENGLIRDCIRCEGGTEEETAGVKAEEGWKPLCEFLGKPIPDRPYPMEASGPGFEKQGQIFWMMAIAKVTVKGIGLGIAATGAYVIALWWMKRRP